MWYYAHDTDGTMQVYRMQHSDGKGAQRPFSVPTMLSEALWFLVLQRSLQLSVEQRSELVQLRRLFISKLSSIIDQRKEIYALLSVSSGVCTVMYVAQHVCLQFICPPTTL